MTENGKSITFLFHNGEILTECDGDSMPIKRHLRGFGLSGVEDISTGTNYAYHQDKQGSTAYVTGTTGETENLYSYDEFGNILESREDITNRILYTGQQYDQETGQYYLRARYYNPVIGRFTQEDTYRGDGLNLYAYCDNNPVMYYDPSGYNQKGGCGETTLEEQELTESRTKWGKEHTNANVAHNNAIEDELDEAFNSGATNIKKMGFNVMHKVIEFTLMEVTPNQMFRM